MKYLLQIYDRGATEQVARLAAEEQQAILGEYIAIGQSPGVLGGEQLQPVDTATTVRVQGEQTLLSDGPFVEAKEHLGGYYLVEADNLDAALEIAARIPAARMGARRLAPELRRVPRPLPAHPGRLEVHRARLRGQIPRHHTAGGLGAPRRGGRPLTRRPRTNL
jgi:hypothetical protein